MEGKARWREGRTDFAVVWPIRAFRPECGPDGAAVGHVRRVEHPETTKVVIILGGEADLEWKCGFPACQSNSKKE